MKKLFVLLLGLVLALGLTGCNNDPLVDEDNNYWATGQFAGWGDAAGNTDYQMEAIAKNDDRVDGLELDDVMYLYLLEVTLPDGEAGWTVTYTIDGTETTVDGNLTVKIIKTDATDADNIPVWWAQSPESGELTNLTEETLYVPPFVEENVDGAGTWNDNPIAFEAGTYYLVFAQYEDGSRAIGLVEVPAE